MVKRLKFSRGFSLNRLDLFITGLEKNPYLGKYKSAFKGRGLEFDGYRKYIPSNDDASRIDWKASKRVGQIVIKEFVEERDTKVFFLVDSSSSMLTGSVKKLKAEYTAEVVAVLSRSVLGAGDAIGLTLFSDKIIREVRAGTGMVKFHAVTDELSKVSNYGGYCDVDKMLEYAYNEFEEGSLVIILSDFVGSISNEKILKLCSKKFDLIMGMVRDPRDLSLPAGQGEIFLEDPGTGQSLLVRPSTLRKEFAREVNLELSRFRKQVKRYGGDFLFLETDKPYLKEIVKFFNMREARFR